MVVALSSMTGSKRMSSPIKNLNSSGEISPKPLNRVISGFPLNFSMASFAPAHCSNGFLQPKKVFVKYTNVLL